VTLHRIFAAQRPLRAPFVPGQIEIEGFYPSIDLDFWPGSALYRAPRSDRRGRRTAARATRSRGPGPAAPLADGPAQHHDGDGGGDENGEADDSAEDLACQPDSSEENAPGELEGDLEHQLGDQLDLLGFGNEVPGNESDDTMSEGDVPPDLGGSVVVEAFASLVCRRLLCRVTGHIASQCNRAWMHF